MTNVVPAVVFQESVVEFPAVIVEGDAERSQYGGCAGGGGIWPEQVTVPYGVVAVPVYVPLVAVLENWYVPPAGGATLPMPLFIENCVAYGAVQVMVYWYCGGYDVATAGPRTIESVQYGVVEPQTTPTPSE